MTTITVAPAPRSSRYGLRQACRAERAKLFLIRSTWWTLFVTVVGTLVVTALSTSSAAHHPPGWYQGFDPTNQSMSGIAIGTLAIGVLGALVFTSEYGSGTIRSSMAATPRRFKFLLAKLLVVGAIVLGVLRWGPHDTAASAPAASASDTTLAPAVSRPPATPLPGPAPSADAPMTPPVARPPSPSSLPLPSVPARTSAPTQPPAGRSGGRPDCNPPYVRGPDGHKMWKRECLDNAP